MRVKLFRGSYYAVWTERGRTRRAALRTKDRSVADQRLAELTQAPEPTTVGEIAAAYLADLDQRAARPDRARDAWKALEPHFAHLRPDQVTRNLCRDYTKARRQMGRADGTINKELGVLRALLRWHAPNTPAVIELPPAPPPRDRHLGRGEYERLLAACAAPHLALFVILALATAGRAAAILDLTWERVDFRRGRIALSEGAKRRKGRATVPMTARARDALGLARAAARTPFVIEYADRPVRSVKRAFRTACGLAGLAGVTPHTLRHTAAVWMAEDGVPMSEIAQYLGHADSRVTERVYARYGTDYLKRAASALE